MKTIQEIQSSFSRLNSILKNCNTVSDVQKAWKSLFGSPLSHESAECFLDYYRDMHRSKSLKQKKGGKRATRRSVGRKSRKSVRKSVRKSTTGGSLQGAPLSYTMTAGAPVAVYGRFPSEIATDANAVQNLDVFYQSGLSRGCGTESIGRTVPPMMGTNQVGGYKRSRRNGKSRKVGGNLLESATMRPFIASPYPNPVQQVYNLWSGNPTPIPAPAAPSMPTWNFSKADVAGIIDPGHISRISGDLSKLASPAPWQTGATTQ
jgi:hypothetical protein